MSDVIIATNGRNLYHKPDPEDTDKPACDEAGHDVEWQQVDRGDYPEYRLCKRCSGDIEWGDAGYRPGDLAGKLNEMDPDEVGV